MILHDPLICVAQMVDASFAFFDKVGDHRVSKSDWEETFKTLMSERANLSRTITDQEKYASIPRLLARTHCAHTNTYAPHTRDDY